MMESADYLLVNYLHIIHNLSRKWTYYTLFNAGIIAAIQKCVLTDIVFLFLKVLCVEMSPEIVIQSKDQNQKNNNKKSYFHQTVSRQYSSFSTWLQHYSVIQPNTSDKLLLFAPTESFNDETKRQQQQIEGLKRKNDATKTRCGICDEAYAVYEISVTQT